MKHYITDVEAHNNAKYFQDKIIPAIKDHGRYVVNKTLSITPQEKRQGVIDDNKVIYTLNSYGHRCDEFIKDHGDKTHVVFFGCSETFGHSCEVGTTWAEYLYEQIPNTSGFFRIGNPSAGHRTILHQVNAYINEFGYPDEIYMLFPIIERLPKYSKNTNFYELMVDQAHWEEGKRARIWTQEEYLDEMLNFKQHMVFLEKLCAEKKIKLYWSFINQAEQVYMPRFTGLKNFVKFENVAEFLFKNGYNSNEELHRRDGKHAGFAFHKFWAQCFLERRNND